ncbi:uncharacterized protein LOC123547364 [Mercenaria mercenaria]|uniref:uncharacterized protein LOC123547364 n=1 Tax=Mercenaria mercenaria TaxID=6596 RepID=UPI00234F0A21|nr:uncharacterized protein LOC123547364 [Mercenaria mercenaria]XP_045190329.2 uncharacterized protein LOC123547364 [Mercenaria mercenaria]
MPHLKKKKSFVAPFSQTTNVSSQKADAQFQLPQKKGGKKELSPVHIGRNVQIITPQTRQKIKQRFALEVSSVSLRATSPGVYVPFDLSQTSCLSQSAVAQDETDQEETDGAYINNELGELHIPTDQNVHYCAEKYDLVETDQEDNNGAEVHSEIKEMHTGISTDQDMQVFDEEYDLELLEEVRDIEGTVKENRNETVFNEITIVNQESAVKDESKELREIEQDIDAKKHKKSNIGDEKESENLSTEAYNLNKAETNKHATVKSQQKSKRKKKNIKPNNALKTKMFGKRIVKMKILKGKWKFFNPKNSSKINCDETSDTESTSKIQEKKRKKVMIDLADNAGKDSMETSDFRPLTSSYRSQNVCNRKSNSKRSFQMVKQEVLDTLYKMHEEIQELVERRKQLYRNIDSREKPDRHSEEDVIHTKQSKNDVLQEE